MTFADQVKQLGGKEVGSEPIVSSPTQNSTPTPTTNFADKVQQLGGVEIGSENQQPQDNKSFGQKVGDFFTGNTQKFGQTSGESLAAPENTDKYNEAVKTYSDINNNLLKTINAKKALGQDTSRLQEALKQHIQDAPKIEDFVGTDTANRLNQTLGQNAEEIGGQALGTVLEATSGGLLDTGVKGLASKTLSTGQKFTQGAKIGTTYGTIGGVSNAMQNQEDLGGVATQGAIGGILGAGLGIGAELSGSAIGKVASSINKSNWFNNLLPKTAARIEKQQGWVSKAQENLAKEYQKALPLTPLQQAKEASLLARRGDNVYTTLAKYNINVANPESVSHLQSLSDQFENATQHAQINEHAYFNIDEIKARAFADINQNLPSETARATAKNKIESEIDALVNKNKQGVTDGPNGTKMINSDLVERLRRTGNSWTNFNSADPEKIGKSTGYALSNAVREQVDKEGTFPSYRYANSEWGKIIHAQQVLEKIDASGKSFRTLGGLSGSIARKVLSGTLGYHAGGIGGAILSELGTEYSARILSSPELRTYFDRKLIERFGSSKATPEAISKLENEIRTFLENQKELPQIPETSSFKEKSYVSPSGIVGKNINEVQGAESTLKQQNVDSMYGQQKANQTSNATSIGINNGGQNIVPNISPTINTNDGFISNTIQNIKNKVNDIPNKQGGFATGIGYKNEGNLTTKILKDLEGKTTVSKQYILDATNRGELKQAERDITRQILDTIPDGPVNVQEFADKVKAELLPLKVNKARDMFRSSQGTSGGRYENIALPDELRGSVKNYEERIYESPIKTSAGEVHFGQPKDKVEGYFGHTRIEDMADNKTRRVIEVQSDLYQKGNLEREMPSGYGYSAPELTRMLSPEDAQKYQEALRVNRESNVVLSSTRFTEAEKQPIREARETIDKLESKAVKVLNEKRTNEMKPLQQYNDPTAHFRMIREEIKKASQDGKTKLQFPTGETAMKIEGLGNTNNWVYGTGQGLEKLTPDMLEIGMQVRNRGENSDNWIITDILGNGKFKAMPKEHFDSFAEAKGVQDLTGQDLISYAEQHGTQNFWGSKESFDISKNVDTNNPIYRFYEKDVQKYLNKFGGKQVVDNKGVSWIEIPITKEQGKAPVEAFGKARLGVVGTGALVGASAVAGSKIIKNNSLSNKK